MDYEPDNLEQEAGISAFEKFGSINTIEDLAGGNILNWDEVMAMPYERVFLKMLINKEKALFSRRYNEVVKSKNT